MGHELHPVQIPGPTYHKSQMSHPDHIHTVNSFLVRTPKIILKLLLKTFSFSSNSDYFHVFEFLILRTLKSARNNA